MRFLPSLALTLIFTSSLRSENWPNWRGPNFDGSSTETKLPDKFSQTENIAWSVDLPGEASSSPVIWGDKVFLTTANAETNKLECLCLNFKSGEKLWSKVGGEGFRQDDKSNYATPSPVVDAKHVWFFFGQGDLLCMDHDGKLIWQRNIQKEYGDFAFLWTFSTSPLLFQDKLYLQVLQRDTAVSGRGKPEGNDSYLLILNPADGKEIARVTRATDAKSEAKEAFTTPTPVKVGAQWQLIIAGGDCLTGHDPATGAELWRTPSWNPTKIGHWRLVPSAVVGGGVALACAPKKEPVYAIKLDAKNKGMLGDDAIAWKSDSKVASSDVSAPLFYDGRFYILDSDRKALTCLAPDGKVFWRGEIPSKAKFECSPTGADGKVYMLNHRGEVSIAKAGGDQFELLHQVDMGTGGEKDNRANIAVSQGRILVRTNKKLWCVGANQAR